MQNTNTNTSIQHTAAQIVSRADQARPTPEKSVCLLSLGRTGSTALSETMHQAGFGWAEEWLNPRIMNAICRHYGSSLSIEDYIALVQRGAVDEETRIFSLKLHVNQYRAALKNHRFDALDRIGFDHTYFLTRQNKLLQAYSHAKAELTDVWTADAARSTPTEPPELGCLHLISCLHRILEAEAYVQDSLRERITRHFTYESLIASDGLRRLLTLMAADLDAGLERQIEEIPAQLPASGKQAPPEDTQRLAALLRQLGLSDAAF